MAILNYTTSIDYHKTIGEIHSIISKRGAGSILTEYDIERDPVGLMFTLNLDGCIVNFRMPSNYKGVLRAMAKDSKISKSKITKEQALKVSWRIIKDWIEAQMAIIDAEIAQIQQVFLPYAVTSNGQTLFEKINEFPGYDLRLLIE